MHGIRHVALLTVLVIGSLSPRQQQQTGQVEWLYYGGDQAGTKYSPLTDIHAATCINCAGPGSGAWENRRRRVLLRARRS